jgi:hypothetical protein
MESSPRSFIGIVAMIGVLVLIVVEAAHQPAAPQRQAASAAPQDWVPSYNLVERRGIMRVIFVANPTSMNLEALGKVLRTEFADEPIIEVLIFDNMRLLICTIE